MDRMKSVKGGPPQLPDSPETALAILDGFALPYNFGLRNLEHARRSVRVLLWPSNLVRAGIQATKYEELRDYSDAAYLLLSNPETRAVTLDLARRANPIIARLGEELLPPIDRAREQQTTEATSQGQTSPADSSTDAATTKTRHARRGHPWRTAAVATILGAASALVVRQYEHQTVALISQSATADEVLVRAASPLEFLGPTSEFCMRHIDRLRDLLGLTDQ
jgi:hypothetical protein